MQNVLFLHMQKLDFFLLCGNSSLFVSFLELRIADRHRL